MSAIVDGQEKVRSLLGDLSVGEIPIAGSKRSSMAISCGGQLYKIGRISENRAFVIIRGNLRLLYVTPEYSNYRYAAKKVFGDVAGRDVDHVLGRRLTQHHRFWYTLLARVDRKANRSHGSGERPPIADECTFNLNKTTHIDNRVLAKLFGRLREAEAGYDIVSPHDRELSISEATEIRQVLGMDSLQVELDCLQPIRR